MSFAKLGVPQKLISNSVFLENCLRETVRYPCFRFRKCENFRFVANLKVVNIKYLNYLVLAYLCISNDEDSFMSPNKTSGSGSRGPVGQGRGLLPPPPGLAHSLHGATGVGRALRCACLPLLTQSFEVQWTYKCTGFKCRLISVHKCVPHSRHLPPQ